MKKLWIFLALLAASWNLGACELYGSVGKSSLRADSKVVGIASVGCRWNHKVDASISWVGENKIYNGQITIPAFPILSVARVWEYDVNWLGAKPGLLMGLTLKEADRCAYNGEIKCNRRLPLPFAFHFGAELAWTDIRIQLYHDSNDALDYGPEKKNLGLNWLTLTYRFR